MNVIKTPLEGVVIIEPRLFEDARGYFFESFSQREFDEKVCKTVFVQDNESKSCYGVVRALHLQKPPYTQSKLVRVVKGAVLDVAVDVRKGSPTYGRFSVLSEEAVFQYKCDEFYAPGTEGAVAWDDPDLGIDWRIPADRVILSEKDRKNPRLKEVDWVYED